MTWYPQAMRRVDILVSGNRKEAVVRELKESGIIELIDVKESGLEKGIISDNYSRISEYIHLIEDALDSFSILPQKKGEVIEKVGVKEEGTEKLLERAEKKKDVIEKIISLKEELKSLGDRKARLDEMQKTIMLLESLDVDPKSLTGHSFVSVFLGKMPVKDFGKAKKDLDRFAKNGFMKTMKIEDDQILMVMTVPNKSDEDVAKVLNLNGFDALKIPHDIADVTLEKAKDKLVSEFGDMAASEEKLKDNLKGLLREKKGLLVLLELLKIEKKLDESEMFFGRTKLTNLISGWVNVKKLTNLENLVKRSSRSAYTISSRKPAKDEIPPTVIGNQGPAKGFELITQSYGLPSYGELDPTKIITLTFPFIFGMMFGDVGHGLMLIIAGFVMSRKIPGEGANKLGKALMVCGVAAAIFGVLYGSAFGLTHENTPQMFEPLWMEPLAEGGKNITYFIKFSITLAVVVLSLGCVLNIVNVGRHSLIHAFFHPWGVLGIWVLLAGYNMFLKHSINFITLTIMGILGDPVALSTILPDLILLVVPVMLVPIGEIFIEKKPVVIGLYGAMEIIQNFLVNTISYVRIVIIAVVHGALLLMVLSVMEIATEGLSGISGTAVATSIFIIGNVGVFGMEAMIALVQTIRLHYYEFFSKFYSAGGKQFVPLKAERNYTVRKT